MNKQISIIIPVYNAEKYLHRSLDSIIAQSYTNWECILVDDGSTDKSGSICDEYVSKDSRFNVIHKQNEGVSIARNRGIDCSKGEYIVFLDADDYLEKRFFIRMIDNSEYPLVICAYKIFGNTNIIKGPNANQCVDVVNDIPSMWNQLVMPYWIYVWGKLFKSSIIRSNRLYFDKKIKYLEDYCFVMRYLALIDKVYLIEDVLVNHYVESGRLSKYYADFDTLDCHMKNMAKCFSTLEEKCSDRTFYLMREKTASDLFRNFILYLKYGQDSFCKKMNDVIKCKEQKGVGLYKYVKIRNKRRKLYWQIWNALAKICRIYYI